MPNTETESKHDEDSLRYVLSKLISDSTALVDFSWNSQIETQLVESLGSAGVEDMMEILNFIMAWNAEKKTPYNHQMLSIYF